MRRRYIMVVVLKAGGPLNQFILMNLATLKDKGATNGTKGTRWKETTANPPNAHRAPFHRGNGVMNQDHYIVAYPPNTSNSTTIGVTTYFKWRGWSAQVTFYTIGSVSHTSFFRSAGAKQVTI